MSDTTTTPAAGQATTDTAGAGAGTEGTPSEKGGTTLATATEPEKKDGQGTQAKEEPKGTQDDKSKTSAPTEIQIKLPEGVSLDDPLFAQFKEVAQKSKMTNESAQAVVDMFVSHQKQISEQHVEQVTKWAEETKADKDIGGDRLNQSLTDAKRALQAFGSKELASMLDATGLGNHKSVISLLVKVSKFAKEDSLPGSGASARGSDETFFDEMYPSMRKQQ